MYSIVHILQLVAPWRVHVGHLHVQIVGYLAAYRTVDEDVQVEVLVTEGVVPTEGPLWKWRTYIGLIILIDDAITIDILVLQVTYIGGVAAAELGWIINPCIVLGSVSICSYRDWVVLLQSLYWRTDDVVIILIYSLYYVTIETVE